VIVKPVFLLADSRSLFSRDDINGVAARIRRELTCAAPKAAYLGASNGDAVEFYDLFRDAAELMGIHDCRMVPARLRDEDSAFLQEADLFLLAGGDVERGWRVFGENGVRDEILRRRYKGSIVVGVSAGAIQLGSGMLTNAEHPRLLDLFGFTPFYVSAHAEQEEWFDLRAIVNLSRPGSRAIGIPSGGCAVYWPDGTLEPLGRSLIELVKTENGVKEHLLSP
jgi:cyanophycinase-like exopeptidase